MRLDPGDVITTGTPPGVGLGFKPPRFLRGGEVITLGIEGLGDAEAESGCGLSVTSRSLRGAKAKQSACGDRLDCFVLRSQ
jgi:hypothetical protein